MRKKTFLKKYFLLDLSLSSFFPPFFVLLYLVFFFSFSFVVSQESLFLARRFPVSFFVLKFVISVKKGFFKIIIKIQRKLCVCVCAFFCKYKFITLLFLYVL